jgi:hypothetical protein
MPKPDSTWFSLNFRAYNFRNAKFYMLKFPWNAKKMLHRK